MLSSHVVSCGSAICPITPSTASVAMKPLFGVKPGRFYLRSTIWIAASHRREFDIRFGDEQASKQFALISRTSTPRCATLSRPLRRRHSAGLQPTITSLGRRPLRGGRPFAIRPCDSPQIRFSGVPPVTAVAVKTVYVFRREFGTTAGGRSSDSAAPVAAPSRFGLAGALAAPRRGRRERFASLLRRGCGEIYYSLTLGVHAPCFGKNVHAILR